jgi:hypothetical protein
MSFSLKSCLFVFLFVVYNSYELLVMLPPSKQAPPCLTRGVKPGLYHCGYCARVWSHLCYHGAWYICNLID